MLGKRGGRYSQDITEPGLTLMATGLTSHQAVSVMRAFLRVEYPDKTEETKDRPGDYRVPDEGRFKEWRRYLGPICDFVALSLIEASDTAHVMSDATTKKHTFLPHGHIFPSTV